MRCPWCKSCYGVMTRRTEDVVYYECDNCLYNWESVEFVEEPVSYDFRDDPDYLWWEKLPRKTEVCRHCGGNLNEELD